jgi:hypothetical protein
MGNEDHIHIFQGEAQLEKTLFDTIKESVVSRVDEDSLSSEEEIGVAIVLFRVIPEEGMEMIVDFHEAFQAVLFLLLIVFYFDFVQTIRSPDEIFKGGLFEYFNHGLIGLAPNRPDRAVSHMVTSLWITQAIYEAELGLQQAHHVPDAYAIRSLCEHVASLRPPETFNQMGPFQGNDQLLQIFHRNGLVF